MASWRQWVGATAFAVLATVGVATATAATSGSGAVGAAPAHRLPPERVPATAVPALPAVTVHTVPPELLQAARSVPASQTVTQTVLLTVIAGPAAAAPSGESP